VVEIYFRSKRRCVKEGSCGAVCPSNSTKTHSTTDALFLCIAQIQHLFFSIIFSPTPTTMGNKKSKKKTQEDKGEEFGAQWNHADANKKADADAKKQAETSDSKSFSWLLWFHLFVVLVSVLVGVVGVVGVVGMVVVLLLHRLCLVNHLPTGVRVATHHLRILTTFCQCLHLRLFLLACYSHHSPRSSIGAGPHSHRHGSTRWRKNRRVVRSWRIYR
jgi:hypothetical protein